MKRKNKYKSLNTSPEKYNKYLQNIQESNTGIHHSTREYDMAKLNFYKKNNDGLLQKATKKKVTYDIMQLSEKVNNKYIFQTKLINDDKNKENIADKYKSINKKNNLNVREYFTNQLQSLKQRNVKKLYESVKFPNKQSKANNNFTLDTDTENLARTFRVEF